MVLIVYTAAREGDECVEARGLASYDVREDTTGQEASRASDNECVGGERLREVRENGRCGVGRGTEHRAPGKAWASWDDEGNWKTLRIGENRLRKEDVEGRENMWVNWHGEGDREETGDMGRYIWKGRYGEYREGDEKKREGEERRSIRRWGEREREKMEI